MKSFFLSLLLTIGLRVENIEWRLFNVNFLRDLLNVLLFLFFKTISCRYLGNRLYIC